MLKKQKPCKKQLLLVVFTLFASMSFLGMSYASWNETLSLQTSLSTGQLDMALLDQQTYTLDVRHGQNELASGAFNVQAVVAGDGKTARLSVDIADLLLALNADDWQASIRLAFPVGLGEAGSIDTIELYAANFEEPSTETIYWTAKQVTLNIAGLNCTPSAGQLAAYQAAIPFAVYREMDVLDGVPTAVVYLKLTDDGRAQLSQLSKTLTLQAEDLPPALRNTLTEQDGRLQGEVQVLYQAELPLYVEQGHHNFWQGGKR